MSLEPGRQLVWIGDLFIDERAPMALCAPHVARVSVPSGWVVNDVRDDAPAFWRPSETDVVVDHTPADVMPRQRVRQRWSSGKMVSLPGLFDPAVGDAETFGETHETDEAAVRQQESVIPMPTTAAPKLVSVDAAPKQSLEGLTAMYGPTGETADEPNPEEDLIDALLAAETPLLARAFRNARAS